MGVNASAWLEHLLIAKGDFNIEELPSFLVLQAFLDLCEYFGVSAAELITNQEKASDAKQHVCVIEGCEMYL